MALPIVTSTTLNTLNNNELEYSVPDEEDEFLVSLKTFRKSLLALEESLERSMQALREYDKCKGLTFDEEAFKVQTVVAKEWSFADIRKKLTAMDDHLYRAEDMAEEMEVDIRRKHQRLSNEIPLISASDEDMPSFIVHRRPSFREDIT